MMKIRKLPMLFCLVSFLMVETPSFAGRREDILKNEEENFFMSSRVQNAFPQTSPGFEDQEDVEPTPSAKKKCVEAALLYTVTTFLGLIIVGAGGGLVWYLGGYVVGFVRAALAP